MCLKARAVGAMLQDIGVLGRQLLAEDSPYRLIGEKLIERYHDEDLTDLYAEEGKPGISPVILAFDCLPVHRTATGCWRNLQSKHTMTPFVRAFTPPH